MKKLFYFLLIATLLLSIPTMLVSCDDLFSEETTTADPSTTTEEPKVEGALAFTLNDDGESYSVAIGTYTGLNIEIPSEYEGKPVTAIANNAFKGCKTIKSVVIPDTVKSIGSYAFGNCEALTSVIVPDSVESIARHAFYECDSLQSITLPFVGGSKDDAENGHFGYVFGAKNFSMNKTFIPETLNTVVITGGSTISKNAFYRCEYITSVAIPESVTSIGASAFNECVALKSIYITDLAKWCNINFETFNNEPLFPAYDLYLNGELVKELVIPDSITSIKSYTFYNCNSLTSVVIPEHVTSIGLGAFQGCSNIKSMALTFVGETKDGTENTHLGYIFGAETADYTKHFISESLTDIIITGSADIPHNAFENCGCLKTIMILGDVKNIGEKAFYYCYNLTNVVIPATVTNIGNDASYGAAGIYNVYYLGSASTWANITIGTQNENLAEDDDTKIYYYSEEEPTAEGNYWHFVEGVPTVWEAAEN